MRSDPDGQAIIQLASTGPENTKQQMIVDIARHIPRSILESEPARREIDREVLARSLIVAADSVNGLFAEKLHLLFPDAKSLASPDELHTFEKNEMLISVAPVKKLPRLQVRGERGG